MSPYRCNIPPLERNCQSTTILKLLTSYSSSRNPRRSLGHCKKGRRHHPSSIQSRGGKNPGVAHANRLCSAAERLHQEATTRNWPMASRLGKVQSLANDQQADVVLPRYSRSREDNSHIDHGG